MTIRTKTQALAEATKRWGKTAAVRDDGPRKVVRFAVGRIQLGMFFEICGNGRSWTLAFLRADLRDAENKAESAWMRRVADAAFRKDTWVDGGVARRAAIASDPAVVERRAKIDAAEAKLGPAPPHCTFLHDVCTSLENVETTVCGKVLCGAHAKEHRGRKPTASGHCATCAGAAAVQP